MKFKTYLIENKDKDMNVDGIQDVISEIKSNCKPFLKEFEKCNGFLYSGRKDLSVKNKIIRQKVRKDRKPRDTDIRIHNMINIFFKKKFGIKARSESLFVTSLKNIAKKYGEIYYVFPIGNYKIIWSKYIKDFYNDPIPIEFNTKYPIDEYFEKIFGKMHLKLVDFNIDWLYILNAFDLKEYEDYIVRAFRRIKIFEMGEDNFKKNIDEKIFKSQVKKEIKKSVEFLFEKIVDYYQTGNLKNAIDYHNEIMLNCDEVIMVSQKFIYSNKLDEYFFKEKLY